MISKGAENESMWNISEGVFLTFGITYADASYGDSLNLEGVTEADLFFAQDYITIEDWYSLENIAGRQITYAPAIGASKTRSLTLRARKMCKVRSCSTFNRGSVHRTTAGMRSSGPEVWLTSYQNTGIQLRVPER